MGWISPASLSNASAPEAAEMHHIGSLASLVAKALAKQVGDIGFIIHNQDAYATRRLPEGQAHNHDAASAIVAR